MYTHMYISKDINSKNYCPKLHNYQLSVLLFCIRITTKARQTEKNREMNSTTGETDFNLRFSLL